MPLVGSTANGTLLGTKKGNEFYPQFVGGTERRLKIPNLNPYAINYPIPKT